MYAIITETETLGWFARPTQALSWLLERGAVEIMGIDDHSDDSPYITLLIRWGQREASISYWSCPAEVEVYPPKPFRKVK